MLEKIVVIFKEHGRDIAKTIGMATYAVGSATIAALSQEGLINTTRNTINNFRKK